MYISGQEINLDYGQWNHICYVWENSAGSWKLYLNGSKTAEGNIGKDHDITSGGSLVLGQDQDKVGGRFRSYQAFVGDLSDVDMWNKELSGEDIFRMSRKCHSEEGNVFKWYDFKYDVHGNAEVVPSSCKA